jgi:hypothetical protein
LFEVDRNSRKIRHVGLDNWDNSKSRSRLSWC